MMKLYILALHYCLTTANPYNCTPALIEYPEPVPMFIDECRNLGRIATHRKLRRAVHYSCILTDTGKSR